MPIPQLAGTLVFLWTFACENAHLNCGDMTPDMEEVNIQRQQFVLSLSLIPGMQV